MLSYLQNLWDLFIDMSFYIVIGLVFTGVLHAFVKRETILKHIGKNSKGAVVKASVIGVPLPLCSCGVVPTALYLGKNGASKGAVISFLTSTPQTGVESIIATYGLLGPFFAAYRAVAAFFSGLITGTATDLLCKHDHVQFDTAPPPTCGCGGHEQPAEASSCCCHETVEEPSSCCHEAVEEPSCCCHETVEEPSCCCHETVEEPSCCCHEADNATTSPSLGAKIKSIFTFAFGDFLDEIAFNFVIGLLIAALISTVIPTEFLSRFSNPFASMGLMLLVGIPMYVCSTASIPIAVSFIIKGISPGSAFVFLFAGPVTNIASLTILTKTLGKKVMAIYLSSIAVCAMAFGLLLDLIVDRLALQGFNDLIACSHGSDKPWYMILVSILFGALVLYRLIKKASKKQQTTSCGCSN